MLKIKESDIRIKLVDKANSHRLIIGKSGYGKTWCSYRMIEEAVESGKQILILDYSGSYTEQELSKGKFEYMDQLSIVNGESIRWGYNGTDFYAAFQDALFNALHLNGYRQKILLRKVVQDFAIKGTDITISMVVEKLEKELEYSKGMDKNIAEAVLDRIIVHADLNTVFGRYHGQDKPINKSIDKPITVIQLSKLETLQKCFLTELFSELFWKGVKSLNVWDGCIVYDEFQNLSLGTGSTLSEMLREGRKYGIGVWLASQFLSDHSTEEQDTLLQVNNILIFRPTEREVKSVARMLDYTSYEKWVKKLEKLDVGEMILKGNFSVINSKKVLDRTVICKVEKENCVRKI